MHLQILFVRMVASVAVRKHVAFLETKIKLSPMVVALKKMASAATITLDAALKRSM